MYQYIIIVKKQSEKISNLYNIFFLVLWKQPVVLDFDWREESIDFTKILFYIFFCGNNEITCWVKRVVQTLWSKKLKEKIRSTG